MSNINSLDVLIGVDNAARGFGFEWPNADMVLTQIIEECNEVKQAFQQHDSTEKIQEEIGDVLNAAISLCIFAGFNVEQTLEKSAKKLDLRIRTLKEITNSHGLDTLKGQTIEYKLQLWDEVKTKIKQGS